MWSLQTHVNSWKRKLTSEFLVELIFDLGLQLASNFCLLGKYFLFNEAVSDSEASFFSLMDTQPHWLVLQMKQKLSLMWSLNTCIKTLLNTGLESDGENTEELTKCRPPSGGEMVCCFSLTLSLRGAPGMRGMSHSFTQTPVPGAGTRGLQPHSRPEGLFLHRWTPKQSALCTRNQCHPTKTPGGS